LRITLVAPRGDDVQVRRERGGGEFEADLVVALAGGAVGDGVGLLGLGDLHHALGDERPRDRGAEEVLALVNRAGAHHRVDEVLRELLLEVIDVNLRGAGLLGLLFEPLSSSSWPMLAQKAIISAL
jgi:NAD(P)-dependent dehydrogenase (short-subunit alcohol dehydrogenase family)